MHNAYKDDKELCKWLRENSSGDYKLSAYAAERIETLTIHLDNVQKECDRLEAKVKAAPDMLEALESTQGVIWEAINSLFPKTDEIRLDLLDAPTKKLTDNKEAIAKAKGGEE